MSHQHGQKTECCVRVGVARTSASYMFPRAPSPPLLFSLHHSRHRRVAQQNIIAELARQADEDDSPLLLGMRQDVLDHVQYLDSFSYNNVFIGEERQILGTKIDFDTPRMGEQGCMTITTDLCTMLQQRENAWARTFTVVRRHDQHVGRRQNKRVLLYVAAKIGDADRPRYCTSNTEGVRVGVTSFYFTFLFFRGHYKTC